MGSFLRKIRVNIHFYRNWKIIRSASNAAQPKGEKMEKKQQTAFEIYLEIFRSELPLGESFDLLERKLRIGGRRASVFFVDGLHDSEKSLMLFKYLLAVPEEAMEGIRDSQEFLERNLPFMEAEVIEPPNSVAACSAEESSASAESSSAGAPCDSHRTDAAPNGLYGSCRAAYREVLPKLYAGLIPLAVEGLDKLIIMDVRRYPARAVEEPEKEKTLRGAKDGFTETLMSNIGLIRRRIRDNSLIFKAYNIGSVSKSDVALAYMKDRADKKLVKKMEKTLEKWTRQERTQEMRSATGSALTVSDQSLLEKLLRAFNAGSGINPFPKVRYSQRPDVIAAHINEGKLAILVDNSPTVMLIPTSVFEFFQDVDDYYFPLLTGNYFRFIKLLNFFLILFLMPVYYLMAEYDEFTPRVLSFFVPAEDFAIPIFWQFILLEIAVDGLKLASLNTPSSLGASLSVIGALILGEFSIESGWFIPQTILCMAVVALAAFTQPSIEFSYAMKFCRIILLVGAYLFGAAGLGAAAIIVIMIMASTKTLTGRGYLYPLIPFDGKILKRLIFRTQK